MDRSYHLWCQNCINAQSIGIWRDNPLMTSLKEFILIFLYKQTFLTYILVQIVIYAVRRGEFCLSVEVWVSVYSYMACNDETATINHQVNQSNKSIGPEFIKVISYNMQMVNL